MRRTFVTVLAVVGTLVTSACQPPPQPAPSDLYLAIQPEINPVVTPAESGIVWGHATVIDDNYEGTLYEGTPLEMEDPRPPAVAGKQPLRMWIADPDNGLTDRPAILWIHGGGFAKGVDKMHELADTVGREYARRGYVSISIEYRLDTTLVVEGDSHPPLCQWVQDWTGSPSDPVFVDRQSQCLRNILAAQRDALGAIRYVRAHAAELGVDPDRIAVGGFSAGAVTAYTTAFRWDDVGTASYFQGDPLSATASRPQATIGASGFLPIHDAAAESIGAEDAPSSFIASRLDPAAPYASSALTVITAREAGLVAELTSYCQEYLHALKLYRAHTEDTDAQWTTFLARSLDLHEGMREPSADAPCGSGSE